jgi:hypothetical protein
VRPTIRFRRLAGSAEPVQSNATTRKPSPKAARALGERLVDGVRPDVEERRRLHGSRFRDVPRGGPAAPASGASAVAGSSSKEAQLLGAPLEDVLDRGSDQTDSGVTLH